MITMSLKQMRHNFITELLNLAMEDGIETKEEADIISNVIRNFDKFNEMLEVAFKDNKITYQAKKDLLKIVDQIDDEAQNIAETDGIVTEDEMQLLYHICYHVGILEEYVKKLDGNTS